MSMPETDFSLGLIEEFSRIEGLQFQPSADIDMLWVLSGPGSVLLEATVDPYKGQNPNLHRINAAIEWSKQIAALKGTEERPPIYYNGETAEIGEPQNEHLRALISSGVLDHSIFVVSDLQSRFTPSQFELFGQDLLKPPFANVKTVGLVTHASHMPRVGRYAQKYRGVFEGRVELIPAAIPDQHPFLAAMGEMKRIAAYQPQGDLAATSYFLK